jgi:hypothetical protein
MRAASPVSDLNQVAVDRRTLADSDDFRVVSHTNSISPDVQRRLPSTRQFDPSFADGLLPSSAADSREIFLRNIRMAQRMKDDKAHCSLQRRQMERACFLDNNVASCSERPAESKWSPGEKGARHLPHRVAGASLPAVGDEVQTIFVGARKGDEGYQCGAYEIESEDSDAW